jgi:phosphorylcholine metabolism protein LicD
MYGGTLIGSWRHHDLVPWDDDVDFAVDYAQGQLAYRALKDLYPR